MKLHVVVDSRIRVRGADVPADVAAALKDDFTHENAEFAAKRAMGIPTYGVDRMIRTWRNEGAELTLPRGGMNRLRLRAREAGMQLEVEDQRTEGAPVTSFPRYVGHEMRWYQDAAIDAALSREQGIVRAPTGSGKSELAYALIARVGLPSLVILPTSGLFNQWTARAAATLGLHGKSLGMIRGSTRRLRPVTIAMQQSLIRGSIPREITDYFGLILIDEAQLASAATYVQVIDQFAARYRVAVSADERRKDRKECVVHDLFGDVLFEVDRDQLQQEGHVLDVEIRCVPTTFRADWYGVPTEGRPEREVDFNRLLDEMTKDEGRNELMLRMVHDEVESGEQAILLTARREHARTLDRYFVERSIPSGYFLGAEDVRDAKEFERTRAGITSGEVRVGVGTYQALGFGIDLPAVSVGAAMTPIAGNDQQLNQVRGRLCRPNKVAGKKSGRLYLALDEHVYPGHLAKIIAKNASVTVWHGGRWVDAREYARHNRRR